MFKYLKNLKLRQGILIVEYGLILSFVITIGYFFLPGNGLEEKVDGVINVVLGRVTSDKGNYGPSRLGGSEEQSPIPTTTAKSVVIDALKTAFARDDCHKKDVLNTITEVQIGTDGSITFFTNNNGQKVPANSCFQGNGSDIIMEIIRNMDSGDTVTPGRYEITIN